MANKNSFNFKTIHLAAVITALIFSFAAGFVFGDDNGYHRGYHKGESLGEELGIVKGQLSVHTMWETATQSGSKKPVKEAVELIETYVYKI